MARTKKNTKSGFTLIEVILFLAISGAILVAILSGTNRSLVRQRYNDAVQDTYSFLESQYSRVISVENVNGNGRSDDTAIYGRIIVFDGDTVSATGGSTINVWTVVGSKDATDVSNTNAAFDSLNLQAVCSEKVSYNTQWGATIETTENDRSKLTRTVAILRSPINGVVYTYRSNNEEALITDTLCTGSTYNFHSGGAGTFSGNFTQANTGAEVDFCIYTEDGAYRDKRRNIRISNTKSINSVNLIPLDEGGNNRCER